MNAIAKLVLILRLACSLETNNRFLPIDEDSYYQLQSENILESNKYEIIENSFAQEKVINYNTLNSKNSELFEPVIEASLGSLFGSLFGNKPTSQPTLSISNIVPSKYYGRDTEYWKDYTVNYRRDGTVLKSLSYSSLTISYCQALCMYKSDDAACLSINFKYNPNGAHTCELLSTPGTIQVQPVIDSTTSLLFDYTSRLFTPKSVDIIEDYYYNNTEYWRASSHYGRSGLSLHDLSAKTITPKYCQALCMFHTQYRDDCLSVNYMTGSCSLLGTLGERSYSTDYSVYDFFSHTYPLTRPTMTPTSPTSSPSVRPSTPTSLPTVVPTTPPSIRPSSPTSLPTATPTSLPTPSPTSSPTDAPTLLPTSMPTAIPSVEPTSSPTHTPSSPTSSPTLLPTSSPTMAPTSPSSSPTSSPTSTPSVRPSSPTSTPTVAPSTPTVSPTIAGKLYYPDDNYWLRHTDEIRSGLREILFVITGTEISPKFCQTLCMYEEYPQYSQPCVAVNFEEISEANSGQSIFKCEVLGSRGHLAVSTGDMVFDLKPLLPPSVEITEAVYFNDLVYWDRHGPDVKRHAYALESLQDTLLTPKYCQALCMFDPSLTHCTGVNYEVVEVPGMDYTFSCTLLGSNTGALVETSSFSSFDYLSRTILGQYYDRETVYWDVLVNHRYEGDVVETIQEEDLSPKFCQAICMFDQTLSEACVRMNFKGESCSLISSKEGAIYEYGMYAFERLVDYAPTSQPTSAPTVRPSILPTRRPSERPTRVPTKVPTRKPSVNPSVIPTTKPTNIPSAAPTTTPSAIPSSNPTQIPTAIPSVLPSSHPSSTPTLSPTAVPSTAPSTSPSVLPTTSPSVFPSTVPTIIRSVLPSVLPSTSPSVSPTDLPSLLPSVSPSVLPSVIPSVSPTTAPSVNPSLSPTENPTVIPTVFPSHIPTTTPSISPTTTPSVLPSPVPSFIPSTVPSVSPTSSPSTGPSVTPTIIPSVVPSTPPTTSPSSVPSSATPSTVPSLLPSVSPTIIPSTKPSVLPSNVPSVVPSQSPSNSPSVTPSLSPSTVPSATPSSAAPSVVPTVAPSLSPTYVPTRVPSVSPSMAPSTPTATPSKISPTSSPTTKPTIGPTVNPSRRPVRAPSTAPTTPPSSFPTIPTVTIWNLNTTLLLFNIEFSALKTDSDAQAILTYAVSVVLSVQPETVRIIRIFPRVTRKLDEDSKVQHDRVDIFQDKFMSTTSASNDGVYVTTELTINLEKNGFKQADNSITVYNEISTSIQQDLTSGGLIQELVASNSPVFVASTGDPKDNVALDPTALIVHSPQIIYEETLHPTVMPTLSPSVRIISQAQSSSSSSGGGFVMIGAGVGGGIFFILVIIACLVWRQRSKKRNRSLVPKDNFRDNINPYPNGLNSSRSGYDRHGYPPQRRFNEGDSEESGYEGVDTDAGTELRPSESANTLRTARQHQQQSDEDWEYSGGRDPNYFSRQNPMGVNASSRRMHPSPSTASIRPSFDDNNKPAAPSYNIHIINIGGNQAEATMAQQIASSTANARILAALQQQDFVGDSDTIYAENKQNSVNYARPFNARSGWSTGSGGPYPPMANTEGTPVAVPIIAEGKGEYSMPRTASLSTVPTIQTEYRSHKQTDNSPTFIPVNHPNGDSGNRGRGTRSNRSSVSGLREEKGDDDQRLQVNDVEDSAQISPTDAQRDDQFFPNPVIMDPSRRPGNTSEHKTKSVKQSVVAQANPNQSNAHPTPNNQSFDNGMGSGVVIIQKKSNTNLDLNGRSDAKSSAATSTRSSRSDTEVSSTSQASYVRDTTAAAAAGGTSLDIQINSQMYAESDDDEEEDERNGAVAKVNAGLQQDLRERATKSRLSLNNRRSVNGDDSNSNNNITKGKENLATDSPFTLLTQSTQPDNQIQVKKSKKVKSTMTRQSETSRGELEASALNTSSLYADSLDLSNRRSSDPYLYSSPSSGNLALPDSNSTSTVTMTGISPVVPSKTHKLTPLPVEITTASEEKWKSSSKKSKSGRRKRSSGEQNPSDTEGGVGNDSDIHSDDENKIHKSEERDGDGKKRSGRKRGTNGGANTSEAEAPPSPKTTPRRQYDYDALLRNASKESLNGKKGISGRPRATAPSVSPGDPAVTVVDLERGDSMRMGVNRGSTPHKERRRRDVTVEDSHLGDVTADSPSLTSIDDDVNLGRSSRVQAPSPRDRSLHQSLDFTPPISSAERKIRATSNSRSSLTTPARAEEKKSPMDVIRGLSKPSATTLALTPLTNALTLSKSASKDFTANNDIQVRSVWDDERGENVDLVEDSNYGQNEVGDSSSRVASRQDTTSRNSGYNRNSNNTPNTTTTTSTSSNSNSMMKSSILRRAMNNK